MKHQATKLQKQNHGLQSIGKNYDSCELMFQDLLNSREMINAYINTAMRMSNLSRAKVIAELNSFGVFLTKVKS